MILKNLKINNFRNFDEGELILNNGTTIFYGGVGEGKTNLLESIFLLSVGRSYRTSESHQLISWGKNEAYVRGEGSNSSGDFSVAIMLSKSGKRIELNGDPLTKSINLIGGLRSVIFHSDDVGIVSGSPHLRRRFLDIALSQASKNYAHNLRDYYRVLKQRNSALAQFAHKNVNDWDAQLSSIGAWLTQVRAKVISEMAQTTYKIMSSFVGEKKKLEIRYMPSGDESIEKFRIKLSRGINADIARGSTSVGPHRDDFKILFDNVEAKHYASCGEQKSIALSLKLAEVEFLRSVTGEKPLLLLDDVFATLDLRRSKALLSVTGDGAQCVITLTDLDLLRDEFRGSAMLYEVKEGKIK